MLKQANMRDILVSISDERGQMGPLFFYGFAFSLRGSFKPPRKRFVLIRVRDLAHEARSRVNEPAS